MRRFVLTLATVVLSSCFLAALFSSVHAAEQGLIEAKITGTITNLEKVKKDYLYPQTYLLLVHENEKVGLGIHGTGALIMLPEAKITQNIGKTGAFAFESGALKPGTYYIYVQPVRGGTLNLSGHDLGCSFLVRENDTERLGIAIPVQPTVQPFILDLGKVWISSP